MKTIRVHFDGRVLVPDEPVDLPVGAAFDAALTEVNGAAKKRSSLQRMIEAARELPDDPDWAPDGAAQLDHYLYGTPKRP